MQLNGWYGLILYMNNVGNGPSSKDEYLRGEFGQGRLWLNKLKKIREQMELEDISNNDLSTNKQKIKFDNHDEATI